MKYFEEDYVDVKSCGDMKKKISTKTLCADLPGRHKTNRIRVFQYRVKTGYFFFHLSIEEFSKYFDYVKKLEFIETPDYDVMIELFQSVYKREKFPDDNLFDWSNTQ